MKKDLVQEFKISLKNRFSALENVDENNTDINELNHIITNSLVETSTKYKENSERSKKLSQETKDLMKRRRDMKTPTNAREKIEAVELNNLIRKKQRQDF